MLNTGKTSKLRKELKLLDVYVIATGSTLSAGFFLLPGIAYLDAGPAIVFSYLIAAIPLIPSTFSIIELATAMPRAGGIYYFLDRTLGPWFGTIGGIGTWLALILKAAFALIGMGAYLQLIFPSVDIIPIALVITLLLGVINYFGSEKGSYVQRLLVIAVLAFLAIWIAKGLPNVNFKNFIGLYDISFDIILATAGMVYISYMGPTKVASLAEEIKDPERNLPLGIFLSILTMMIIYGFGVFIMTGTINPYEFAGNQTPFYASGMKFLSGFGKIIMIIAVFFAFISVANAGMMSASRFPLAMSRDHILPRIFIRINRRGTPFFALATTIGIIALIITTVKPIEIAKMASAFQFIIMSLVCVAVIVMRESRIESYDPSFKSPFYPWMQLFGIISQVIILFKMGWMPLLVSILLITLCSLWYWYYAKDRIIRNGAIFHMFERLGKNRYFGLDTELRGILKEKGLRKGDPFNDIIAHSHVVDFNNQIDFDEIVNKASSWFANTFRIEASKIAREFTAGRKIGLTPVTKGIALPHIRAVGIDHAEMVLVRVKNGLKISSFDFDGKYVNENVFALFFLMSPDNDPAQHLRILAQIARKVEKETFIVNWLDANDDVELKMCLIRN